MMTGKTAAIVVTSCSKRKSLEPATSLRAGDLEPGDPASLARHWTERIADARERVPARELYRGRAFREAELASQPLDASLYVLSAGLGLIPADRHVPSYSLTVANGADNILERLDAPGTGPGRWWRELVLAAGTHSFADLLKSSSGLLLVAAPTAYLGMVGADLETLDAHDQERLRIFTAAPRSAVPAPLAGMVMPYDRRLEALPGRAGTLSDFAQRALRHFADVILKASPDGSTSAHREAVLEALAGLQPPSRRRGKSLSDTEIVAIIAENWNRAGGKSAAMLRLLRDAFCIACEQKRFKKLFAAARLVVTE